MKLLTVKDVAEILNVKPVRYAHLAPENLRKAVSVLDATENRYVFVI